MTENILKLPIYYTCGIALLFGLIIGSFLNVVVLRAFSGESIVLPPSKCPHCKNKLKWYHNIPVISYLFLRGKCGFCKEPISIQYPLVELFTGITFMSIFQNYGFTLTTLFAWIFAALAIVISVCDFKEKVIFVEHTYILAFFGILYNILNISGSEGFGNLWNSLLGILCGFVFFIIVIKISKKLLGREAFGEGDAYILGAIGAVIGFKPVLACFVMAVVLQALSALPQLIISYIKQKKYGIITAFVLFGILCSSFAFLQQTLLANMITYIIYMVATVALAIIICRFLLKDIKQGSHLEPLPFGPMLLFAAAILFVNPNFVTEHLLFL